MKAIVVKKEFNSLPVGTIIGFGDVSNNHLANEGFIVAVEIPEGMDKEVIKCEQQIFPEKWVKEGHPDLFEQPVTEEIIGYDGDTPIMSEPHPDTSYTHIPEKIEFSIVEDTAKKASHVQQKKVDKYVKRIDYAKTIIATMAFLNEGKNLTVPQIISMNTTYGPIKGLLETASFGSAYQQVMAIVPNEAITESDIEVISGMISDFMSKEV